MPERGDEGVGPGAPPTPLPVGVAPVWPQPVPKFTSRASLALKSCVRCPHLGERSWHLGAWKEEGAAGAPCRQSPRAALGRELSLEGCPLQTAGAGECPGLGLAPGPWELLSESSPGRAIAPE